MKEVEKMAMLESIPGVDAEIYTKLNSSGLSMD